MPDELQTQCLDNAVAGVPHLASVLTMDKAARKAAGINKNATFDEAIGLLQQAAQTYDEGNQMRRPYRPSRSANIHQLDDDSHTSEDEADNYQVSVHDAHTPVEE